MKKVNFNIQGMTCSSCSAHVEKAVNKLPGIKSLNVNLLSNSMSVEYDSTLLNDEKIINAVEEAGYGASLQTNDNKKSQNIVRDEKNNNDVKSTIISMKKRLVISFCFLIPLMYIAMHNMLNNVFGIPVPEIIQNIFDGPENAITFAITQLLLLVPIIYLNRNYFQIGFKRLFKGSPNMDSLIALGSSASTVYGIFAIYMIGYGLGHNDLELVQRYSMDIYFESAGTILTLITLGKYLETKSKGKTSDAITKLINLAPKTAFVLRNNDEIEIGVDEIREGDIVIIKPGGSIPVDGVVAEGGSSIDESAITGESIPVEKNIGDTVISGTINKNGYFKMKATKVGENTTLSQIVKLVEEAGNSKAPISKLADKVSGIFVPVVIVIAILAAIGWLLAGESFEFALSTGIAVLVISCPCALGLATPVAIMVGTGKGAENGILIKSAESLEMLHHVDTVVLDKTGTITAGKPTVIDILSNDERYLLKIAGSLEKNSQHPLADAVLQKVKEENIELEEVEKFTSISGRGVKGRLLGEEYFGGNEAFMLENKIDIKQFEIQDSIELQGKTKLYFARKNELVGIITIADKIKETSVEAISQLQKKNIEVIMITGDSKDVAQSVGSKVGIKKIVAEVLPVDKEKEVKLLQEQGQKVAFVGDGINDSPALVRADIGIAIGSGTDIAIESADLVLIKNSLLDVVTAIDLSKSVINNIKMNLFWAFFYNTIGIPVAAGLLYPSLGLKLNPMIGAAAMSFSSVCVVTNALRLRKFKTEFNNVKSFDKVIIKENNDKGAKKNMSNNTKIVEIDGMQCNHCKMTVEKVLGALDGVIKAEVNLERKNAIIESEKEIDNNKIIDVITEAGFEVKGIK